MKMRAKLAGAAALAVVLGVGFYAFTAHSQDRHHGHGPFNGPFGGGMGMGPGNIDGHDGNGA